MKGQQTPYYYEGDGQLIAFMRIGNESVPATPAQLRELVLRGSGESYDSYDSYATQANENVIEISEEKIKIWDIVRLIRLKVITYDELSDFSDELQNEVKRILEMNR